MRSSTHRSTPRQIAVTALALLVSIATYLFLTSGLAAVELVSARNNAQAAKAAADTEDFAAVVSSVKRLRGNIVALNALTSGPEWLAVKSIPIAGAPVRTATDLISSTEAVAAASGDFLQVAESLIASTGDQGGEMPDDVLRALGPASASLAAALEQYQTELAVIDIGDLPGPAETAVAEILSQVQGALPGLIAVLGPTQVIANMLSKEVPQTWFIALQNGGEARGTGGLVGAYAVLDVTDGKATVVKSGTNADLTALGDSSGLPPSTLQLWGPERLTHYYGVNLSPHYPFAGQLLSSLWHNQSGTAPDAVLAFDQHSAAALLAATGPITVDGITVTPDDALHFLTVGVYERFPDPAEKDAFVAKLIADLLTKLAAGQAGALDLVKALVRPVLERRVFLWSADPANQALLETAPLGGIVPEDPGAFAMGVINNNAGSKMDAFLHTDVSYVGGECTLGGRHGQITVTLRNLPPASLPSYVSQRGDRADATGDGSNLVRLYVYLPLLAVPTQTLHNGTLVDVPVGEERNHPVVINSVELARDETKTVTVKFTEVGSAEALNKQPVVIPQPMLHTQKVSAVAGPACSQSGERRS